jgi:hypothetical protein
MASITILNFAHPLTDEQLAQASALLGQTPTVASIPTQVDRAAPVADEARRLVDAVGWSPERWQTTPFVLNPPALAPVALALLAELHGRCGYFPPVLNIRPLPGELPPRYEVAAVVDLNALREQARTRRA